MTENFYGPVPAPAADNGAAALLREAEAIATPRPRFGVRRVEEVALDETGYPGLWVKVWTNPGERLAQSWATETGVVNLAQVLADLVVEWNLPDEDGHILPITRDVIEDLPSDLQAFVFGEIAERRAGPLRKVSERLSLPSGKASATASPGGTPSPATPSDSA